jgi:hypothetical protein
MSVTLSSLINDSSQNIIGVGSKSAFFKHSLKCRPVKFKTQTAVVWSTITHQMSSCNNRWDLRSDLRWSAEIKCTQWFDSLLDGIRNGGIQMTRLISGNRENNHRNEKDVNLHVIYNRFFDWLYQIGNFVKRRTVREFETLRDVCEAEILKVRRDKTWSASSWFGGMQLLFGNLFFFE